ncbi:guanine nucleotide-binding protein subunit gamma 3-like isoform X1 [Lolium perenne]|uniref:guanine nucleotide-binding protein subunit gamma 3-like isoform X1 n=1 Tax=Lolium perenne TaxID=4522 RepID=UPI0021F530DE|nr:guanine nucleotide-binding protein subunit gamma 3-like [Lolium perenne]
MMAMAAPRPKSPPSSPDPCGRHRLQLAVDTLHREIGFLEGEINSIEGVHAASKCCKEVDEFVGKNADPFITISSKNGNTDRSHHLPKKFRARTCLSYLSWICCCGGCSTIQIKGPSCCCSCGGLERMCRCCSGGRCRVGCGGCSGGCCCTSPCPRCSCGCTCSCPSCCSSSSCACLPTSCSTGCCGVPRCCLCL